MKNCSLIKQCFGILIAILCFSTSANAQIDPDISKIDNCAAFAMAELYHEMSVNTYGDLDQSFEEGSEAFISAVLENAEMDPFDPYSRLIVVQNLIPTMLHYFVAMKDKGPLWFEDPKLMNIRKNCVTVASRHNKTNGVYQ